MAQGWQRIDSNGTATDEIFGRSMASFFLASCSLLALWLAISAMDSIKGLHVIWPFACEQCSVAGGLPDMHREAKQYIAMHRSSGHTYVQVWAMARSVNDLVFRRAILSRLSTRFSKNNPLHHALVTEASCLEKTFALSALSHSLLSRTLCTSMFCVLGLCMRTRFRPLRFLGAAIKRNAFFQCFVSAAQTNIFQDILGRPGRYVGRHGGQ